MASFSMVATVSILLALWYQFFLVQGREIGCVYGVYGGQKEVARKNIDIHMLCGGNRYFHRMLHSDCKSPHRVLSWCMDWNYYLETLASSCLQQQHVVAVVDDSVRNDGLLEAMNAHKYGCPYYKWFVLKDTGMEITSTLEDLPRHIMGCGLVSANTCSQLMSTDDSAVLGDDKYEKNHLSWKSLSGNKLLMGCVLLDRPGSREPCFTAHESTIVDALNGLNVTYEIIPVAGGMFAKSLRNGETDIVITGIGISADRYRSFDFAINIFRQAVFYVKKRWRHRAEVFLGAFPWIILLALSIIASVSFFAVLNVCHGKPALKGMGGVTLSLIAATLSLSFPLRGDHARSKSSGFVMVCWMLACFSLTTYTRSLLTASLMAQPTSEADDTLEKMLPKLQRGRLLPCAESYSFLAALLARARGNGTDVVSVMARSAKQWAHSREDFTGNITSCVRRTRKGTHVLFTASIDLCYFLRLKRSIAPGRKPIQSIVGGFPIRKDYPLRTELIMLLQRIFETGWDIKLRRLADSNCTEVEDEEETPLCVKTLLYAYCACCAVSSAAFFVECLSRNLCVEKKPLKRMPTAVPKSKCRIIVVKPTFRIVNLY